MSARRPAVFLLALAAAGCAAGPIPTATPTPTPLATVAPATPSPNPFAGNHYDDGMLAFDFPGEWNAERSWYPSSVSNLKAYLSTETLRPACVRSGDATLCRSPVEELSPGGLLVSWWRWGLNRGAPGPDPTSGELMHVGGRSARLHDAGAEGHCLNIEADATLRLEIPDPTLNGSWTVMDACMREPTDDARAKIDAMLASVEWSAPQPTQLVPLGDVPVSLALYDDSGLVTAVASGGSQPVGNPPEAIAHGDELEIHWIGGPCGRPTLGLSLDAGRLLVLLEPDAGIDPTQDCDAMAITFSVAVTLSEPIAQDDLYLEVW